MGVSIAVTTACCGFLIAILWIDLVFDVQVIAHRGADELPESVLVSIAAYYRRATITSRPMGHLIAVVMAILLVAVVVRAVGGRDPDWLSAASILLATAPIVLALSRTVPNAMRLGERAGTTVEQTRRARSVLADHVLCLACEVTFLALWLVVTFRATP